MSTQMNGSYTSEGNDSILVVEDNQDLNLAICEILASHEYGVKSAENGKEALEMIAENKPDVILCDIMMPKMDGYTLLRHTRANPELRSLPFIFLTARTSTNDQRQALTIGIEDYLTKPVDEQDLVLAIENALRRQRMMAEDMQIQLDLLRAEIVGILQHEFRTPLTFVLGYAQYLEDILDTDIDTDDLRIAIKGILEGGDRLHRLIEGFLLLAELQNKPCLPEDMKHVRVSVLFDEVIQDLQKQLSEANLEVVIEGDIEGAWITCEYVLMVEAVKRLLDNSIRYRRPESKQIKLIFKQPPDPYVGICVEDSGVGIPQETIDSLSRPFEQGDRSDRTEPGAGLSLAMIKHIAGMHGGKLQIDSTIGIGTTCTMWLAVMDIEADSLANNPSNF